MAGRCVTSLRRNRGKKWSSMLPGCYSRTDMVTFVPVFPGICHVSLVKPRSSFRSSGSSPPSPRLVASQFECRVTVVSSACVVQVDYIIKEATSSDNLCMMYEGWMSWVWACERVSRCRSTPASASAPPGRDRTRPRLTPDRMRRDRARPRPGDRARARAPRPRPRPGHTSTTLRSNFDVTRYN